MSDTMPEPSRRGGNAFTRRIGPLPMWQWFLIALAMIGVYVIYSYRKKNAAAANAANSAAGTGTGGTTGAGQVPQFVNQTYTYVAPPSAQPPPPGSTGSTGSAGPVPRPAVPSGFTPPPSGGVDRVGRPVILPPNLRGLTVAQATQQLPAGWTISGISLGGKSITASQAGGRTIASYTPYPQTRSVRIGLN